jgi:Zn-dependent protease with chaperone function
MNIAASWVLPWIAFAATWLALCPVAFALHRLARRSLTTLVPQERSTLLFALAALPLTVAALVAALGFAPVLGGLFVDHCHAGTGCGPHVPLLHTGTLAALLLGAALLAVTFTLCGRVAGRLRRSQRLARTLGLLAEPAPRERCELIESPSLFAYCVGLWRPKVVISTGLKRKLSREELDAVVAHEDAHAARRDNLRHGIAALCLLPLDLDARRALLADLSLASEQACDRAAAERTSTASLLAALRALHPAAPDEPTARDAHFAVDDSLASRSAALGSERAGSPGTAPVAIVGVYAICTLAATYVAHHATDLVLAWLG